VLVQIFELQIFEIIRLQLLPSHAIAWGCIARVHDVYLSGVPLMYADYMGWATLNFITLLISQSSM